ncbi:MAG: hypothetical protein D6704_04745 [Nitrospirae bacterium]|nr:MAG: hypothetical protein D6704_04745 [Nitrospirota bacterium]
MKPTRLIVSALVVAFVSGCATTTKPDAEETRKRTEKIRAAEQAALLEPDPEVAYAQLSNIEFLGDWPHQEFVARFAFLYLPEKFMESVRPLILWIDDERLIGQSGELRRRAYILHSTTRQQILTALAGEESLVSQRIAHAVRRACLSPVWPSGSVGSDSVEVKADRQAVEFLLAKSCQAWIHGNRTRARKYVAQAGLTIMRDPHAAPAWFQARNLAAPNAPAIFFADRIQKELGVQIALANEKL